MSAPTQVARLCAITDCVNPIVRRPGGESHVDYEARKYCSRACAALARRKTPEAPQRPQSQKPGLNSAPPPTPLRYEAGVWRPNAPGWPARPATRNPR